MLLLSAELFQYTPEHIPGARDREGSKFRRAKPAAEVVSTFVSKRRDFLDLIILTEGPKTHSGRERT